MHCLTHTESKLIVLDLERLDRISQALPALRAKGVTGVLVFETPRPDSNLMNVDTWEGVIQSSEQDPNRVLVEDPHIQPEDNATIIFTSGTCVHFCILAIVVLLTNLSFTSTGLPKGVLSTQRQFLTNIRNVRDCQQRDA